MGEAAEIPDKNNPPQSETQEVSIPDADVDSFMMMTQGRTLARIAETVDVEGRLQELHRSVTFEPHFHVSSVAAFPLPTGRGGDSPKERIDPIFDVDPPPPVDGWAECPVDVDWKLCRERWIWHLRTWLERSGAGAAGTVTHLPSSGTVRHVFAIIPRGGDFTTQARLGMKDGRMVYQITGPQKAVAEQKPSWQEAFKEARKSLLEDPPTVFRWSAAIGPEVGHGVPWRLDGEATVGGLRLASSETWLAEFYPDPHNLAAFYRVDWWPLIVHGTSSGYLQPQSVEKAEQDVYGLCSLFTLAWGEPLARRHAPISLRPEWDPEDVTDWIGRASQGNPDQGPPPPQMRSIPEWFEKAWKKRRKNKAIRWMIDGGYSQGVRLLQRHPSFAAVAFMTVLESMGLRLAHGKKGMTKEAYVEFALRQVFPDTGISRLFGGELYSRRSETAHDGTLFGTEYRFGHLLRMSGDDAHAYLQDLAILQHACRALLVRELGGPFEVPHLLDDIDFTRGTLSF